MADDDRENSGEDRGLIPQPHGGALLPGGKPGNRGGGRKPNKLVKALEEDLEKAAADLRKKMEAGELGPREQITYARFIAQYVMPKAQQPTVDKTLVDEIWAAIEEDLPDELRLQIKKKVMRVVGRRISEAVLR